MTLPQVPPPRKKNNPPPHPNPLGVPLTLFRGPRRAAPRVTLVNGPRAFGPARHEKKENSKRETFFVKKSIERKAPGAVLRRNLIREHLACASAPARSPRCRAAGDHFVQVRPLSRWCFARGLKVFFPPSWTLRKSSATSDAKVFRNECV